MDLGVSFGDVDDLSDDAVADAYIVDVSDYLADDIVDVNVAVIFDDSVVVVNLILVVIDEVVNDVDDNDDLAIVVMGEPLASSDEADGDVEVLCGVQL